MFSPNFPPSGGSGDHCLPLLWGNSFARDAMGGILGYDTIMAIMIVSSPSKIPPSNHYKLKLISHYLMVNIQGVPLRRRLAYNIQYLRNACMYQNQILYMCSWTLYEQPLFQQLFSPTPNFGGIDSLLRVLWRFFKSILRIFEIFSILKLSAHFQVFYRL